MTNEELQNTIEELEKKLKESEDKIAEISDELKKQKLLLETHKHSGKETSDVSKILEERLGIKISTITGSTGLDKMSIDIAGVLKSFGRIQFGETKVHSFNGINFGVEWSGGGHPFFSTNAEFLFPVFSSNPTPIIGSVYYNTAVHKLRVCENGIWRTITTS